MPPFVHGAAYDTCRHVRRHERSGGAPCCLQAASGLAEADWRYGGFMPGLTFALEGWSAR
jgi:hypothetical protein